MGFATLGYRLYLRTITGPYSQINTLNIYSQETASELGFPATAPVRPEPTQNICKEPPVREEHPQATAAAQEGCRVSHGVPSEQNHGVCSGFQQMKRTIVLVGLMPSIYRKGGTDYRSLFTSKIIRQRGWRGNGRFKMERLQYSASSHKKDHAKIQSMSTQH